MTCWGLQWCTQEHTDWCKRNVMSICGLWHHCIILSSNRLWDFEHYYSSELMILWWKFHQEVSPLYTNNRCYFSYHLSWSVAVTEISAVLISFLHLSNSSATHVQCQSGSAVFFIFMISLPLYFIHAAIVCAPPPPHHKLAQLHQFLNFISLGRVISRLQQQCLASMWGIILLVFRVDAPQLQNCSVESRCHRVFDKI